MMFTFNDSDKAVQELLNKKGVKYSFNYVGASHDDEWSHDLWNITFFNNGIKDKAGSRCATFEYKTRIGHRLTRTLKGGAYNYMTFGRLQGLEIAAHRGALQLPKNASLYFPVNRDEIIKTLFAVAPTAASVLYCLLSDASASNESVKDWCDNYGYDSDSIKALNIYNQCIANAEKLSKVFKPTLIEQLSSLLEDY
jgi:hypothetical protein